MKNREFEVRHSIRNKLILFILIPLLAVYTLVLFLTYIKGREDAISYTKDYLSELTGHAAAEMDIIFNSVSYEARSIADTISSVENLEDRELFRLVLHKIQRNSFVYGMAIAYGPFMHHKDKEHYSPYYYRLGNDIISLDLGERYNYFVSDWYLIPKRLKRPYWSEPYFDEGGGDEIMVTYSHPVIKRGEVKAIATADISLNYLKDTMKSFKIFSGYPFIVTRTGTFVYHPIEDYIMNETLFSLAQFYSVDANRALSKEIINQDSGVLVYEDYITNERKWLVFTRIESCDWTFAAVIPESEILKTVHRSLLYQALTLIGGMFIIILIIIGVSYTITGPIKKLIGFAETVSDGNLCVEITDIKGSDEISELTFLFNKMAKDLRAHINELMAATKAKESVESELRIARQIQESLLPMIFPPFPEIKELELYAKNIAAKEVAGDFYDFYKIDDNRLAILIADVSGKGLASGLYMVIARTLTKLLCQKEGSTPVSVMNECNKVLCQDNESCMFITVFLAFYEINTGRITYSNAGHKGSNIISPDGIQREVPGLGNMAMGILETENYRLGTEKLERGEVLALFTDGVTEATSKDNKLYGEDKFFDLIIANIDKSLDSISNLICNDLMVFQEMEQFDDITLLLLRRSFD